MSLPTPLSHPDAFEPLHHYEGVYIIKQELYTGDKKKIAVYAPVQFQRDIYPAETLLVNKTCNAIIAPWQPIELEDKRVVLRKSTNGTVQLALTNDPKKVAETKINKRIEKLKGKEKESEVDSNEVQLLRSQMLEMQQNMQQLANALHNLQISVSQVNSRMNSPMPNLPQFPSIPTHEPQHQQHQPQYQLYQPMEEEEPSYSNHSMQTRSKTRK